jgi:hypothetical protein
MGDKRTVYYTLILNTIDTAGHCPNNRIHLSSETRKTVRLNFVTKIVLCLFMPYYSF